MPMTVAAALDLENPSTEKKKSCLNHCSTISTSASPCYEIWKWQPCFHCSMNVKRPDLEGMLFLMNTSQELVFITEKSGRKNVNRDNFFLFSSCCKRLGSVKKQLFDKMFCAHTSELGFCHSVLQEQSNCSHSSFGVEFRWIFYSSLTVIFVHPVLLL